MASAELSSASEQVDQRNDDFEQVVRKTLAQELGDWPNEAGFDGLTEVCGPVDLKVIGTIPSWAAGSLYRIGPGQFNVEDTPTGTFRTTHWFDGFAHMHKFTILPDAESDERPVRVEYTSRFQSRDYVDKIKKLGKTPYLSFGQRQDPCVGIFAKFASLFRTEDPNPTPSSENISVAVYGDIPGMAASAGHRGGCQKVMCVTTDATVMRRFDAETLEPIGVARQACLHPLLKGPLSSAHAQRDPETGDVYNFNLEMGRQATYRIWRLDAATGQTDILAAVCQSHVKPSYIHSFFLSPSFVILCVPSAHIGYMGLSVPWNGNVMDAIEPFDESKRCQWFVVDRRHGRGVVATFETPAGFFFHSVNAFEEENESTGEVDVTCDVMEYPTTDIIRAYELDIILRAGDTPETYWSDEQWIRNRFARLVRRQFRIPASTTRAGRSVKIECERVFEIQAPHAGELPTINPAYATKKYRYVWSLPSHGNSTLHEAIVKTDVVARRTTSWMCPPGHTPGEAIFVARPRAQGGEETRSDSEDEEDDGVLLSVVLDGLERRSYLVCLDAKTMTETGRAECEWAIGHGFHGLHTQARRRTERSGRFEDSA